MRHLSHSPLSIKQASELHLPPPAGTVAGRRTLVLLLLACGKLRLVPTTSHRDGALVETASDVHNAGDLRCTLSMLAPPVLCSHAPNVSSGHALDMLVSEYRTRLAQHQREHEHLHELLCVCLEQAHSTGRSDLIRELQPL